MSIGENPRRVPVRDLPQIVGGLLEQVAALEKRIKDLEDAVRGIPPVAAVACDRTAVSPGGGIFSTGGVSDG